MTEQRIVVTEDELKPRVEIKPEELGRVAVSPSPVEVKPEPIPVEPEPELEAKRAEDGRIEIK